MSFFKKKNRTEQENQDGYGVVDWNDNSTTEYSKLFENDRVVLGDDDELSNYRQEGEEGSNQKSNNKGIPCIVWDDDGRALSELPDIIYKLFAKEYGIVIKYNSTNKLIQFDSEIETSFKVSQSAKKIIFKELQETHNKNKIVVGNDLYNSSEKGVFVPKNLATPTDRQISPAFTLNNTSYFDVSFFDSDTLLYIKMFEYIEFSDEKHKRTANFCKVFEHDFIGHNVKNIHNDIEENPSYKHYKGSYKPGRVENLVNSIRIENGLSEVQALNYVYVEVKDNNLIMKKFFGSSELLSNITSLKDIGQNYKSALFSDPIPIK